MLHLQGHSASKICFVLFTSTIIKIKRKNFEFDGEFNGKRKTVNWLTESFRTVNNCNGTNHKFTVFYNHFVTIFRTLMSFFTTLDTKLTTNDQNAHFSKL